MNKVLSGLAITGVVALGLAMPSSAAPSAPTAPTADAPTSDLKFRVRTSDETGFEKTTPPRTEGIAGGFVFVPINPYRAFDTRRIATNVMVGGKEIIFDVLTNEDLVAQIPSTAVAVTYNLTITQTVGSGYLSIYPADINWPGTSSINFTTSGQTLANGGTVAVGLGSFLGELAVYCGPNANIAANFIVDITGYYI